MARPLRIEYAGAWYHVMNRGAGKREIFPDDFLRREFLDLLSDLHERYSVCCHAYCLMGNHYHLLLQTRQANLGRAMRHLDGVYTQRHNRHMKTDGPLFRGRYKAQLIDRDNYFLSVSRYVHRNPLVAGLCDRLVDYPWSSYPVFAELRAAPDWLHRHETIAPFRFARHYCAFVEGPLDDAADGQFLTARSGKYVAVLGSAEFVTAAQKAGAVHYEIPQSKVSQTDFSLTEIIDFVAARFSVSRKNFFEASNKEARERRAITMLLARQYGGFTLRQIGEGFGIRSYTTVASAIDRCRNKAGRDPALAGELARLRERLKKMRNA